MLSHEVKWPISSTLLQWECILDDVESWNYNKNYLIKEIWIMNNELLKIWNLTSKLFDVSTYEIKGIKLYKERVDFLNLVKSEINSFEKSNKNIKFISNLKNNVWSVFIDVVYFRQVIGNLLTNACKFSRKNKWCIIVNCFVKNKYLFFEIEDNWKGFEDMDITNIFEKYSTWEISWVWLWMWLYLCKKIVELHKWNIKASISEKLLWAKFIIKIPVN